MTLFGSLDRARRLCTIGNRLFIRWFASDPSAGNGPGNRICPKYFEEDRVNGPNCEELWTDVTLFSFPVENDASTIVVG